MVVWYGQSGYVGSSMSVRAAQAYDDGEMPKSKWTKKAMISAILDWCEENDRVMPEAIEKMKKDDIFNCYFYQSSWHHTSKYANPTDFYSVDEEELEKICEKLDEELIEVGNAAEKELKEAYEQAVAELEERWKDAAELQDKILKEQIKYEKENGFKSDGVLAYAKSHPELVVTAVSKKGNDIFRISSQRGNHQATILARDFTPERVNDPWWLRCERFDAVLENLTEDEKQLLQNYKEVKWPEWPTYADLQAAHVRAINEVLAERERLDKNENSQEQHELEQKQEAS